MKVFVALLAVVAIAVAQPTPLVQVIVNVDAPAGVSPIAVDTPIETDKPVPGPVNIVDNLEEPIFVPAPVILPQPVLPEIVPEPVVIPAPVLPEVVIPEPVVLPLPALPEVVPEAIDSKPDSVPIGTVTPFPE